MKGASGEEELAAARGAIKKLGGAYKETRTLHLPGGDTRTLICAKRFRKLRQLTPETAEKSQKAR